MTGSLSGHIYEFAAAVWRRRMLILVPLLVSIPLSVIAASMMPKKYVATTLLLLQEGGGANPLQATGGRGDAGINERMAGLEALLKSEYILLPALEVIMADKFPTSPREQALELESLKAALSIELIGKSFMRLSLRGSKPDRLGDALSAIVTSFLDSLLTANKGPPAVTQFLLDQHRSRMEAAQNALQVFKSKLGDTDLSALPLGDPGRLAALTSQLDAAEADVAKADAEVAELATGIGRETIALPALEVDIATATSALDKAPAGEPKTDELRRYLEQLTKIADKARAREGFRTEVLRITAERDAIRAKIAEHTSLIDKAARLERNLTDATERYQSFSMRYADADAATRRALKVLESPESVRVIDPPKDPELGLMSRFIYVLAGIMAGLGVGASGAVVAEALDRRVRRPEEFEAVLGAPIICHLPAFDPSEEQGEEELPSNVAQLPRIERSSDDVQAPRASG